MGLSIGLGALVSVLQLIALVFLILATISTPVVESFALGTSGDFTFGVFGYCESGNGCLKATFPWTPSTVGDKGSNWAMSSSARDSLAKILIICPIAAGIVFISFILSVAAIFASHTLAIVSIVATLLGFIVSAIICIVTILLFYPNVSWTGWILIGSAAAMLVSLPILVLGIKFGSYHEIEDHSSSLQDIDNYGYAAGGKVNDLTRFDDDHDEKFFVPPTSTAKKYDETVSSVSSFRQQGSNSQRDAANVTGPSNASIYNSNPQNTYDFTNRQQDSQRPKNGSGSGIGSGAGTTTYNSDLRGGSSSVGSYFNDDGVSLVNGPNIPVSAKRNMAPHLVAVAATPTMDGQKGSAPYPVSTFGGDTPRVGAPGAGLPYNRTVFEHHPEVEGHRPFTEMDDQDQQQAQPDILDSDNESDFTSVSQRAPNPQYYSQGPPPPPPHQQQPPQNIYSVRVPLQQQQHQSFTSSYSSNYQPGQAPPPPQGAGNYQQQQQQPIQQQPQQQGYFNQAPPPQTRGPTISDNALSNNPDFAVGGGGFSKKPIRSPLGPSFGGSTQSPYNVARNQRSNQQGGRPNIPAASSSRDGPYSFR